MSSVIVCDYNVCISTSRTILGISEHVGEARICRLYNQVLFFVCIVQKSGRTEQNSYGLFQN
jgi:hypothetical protein